MPSASTASTPRVVERYQRWLPDLRLGLQNLLLHRLRSMLTMLGMIFGVTAVAYLRGSNDRIYGISKMKDRDSRNYRIWCPLAPRKVVPPQPVLG